LAAAIDNWGFAFFGMQVVVALGVLQLCFTGAVHNRHPHQLRARRGARRRDRQSGGGKRADLLVLMFGSVLDKSGDRKFDFFLIDRQ
jgi:hypothetical protein